MADFENTIPPYSLQAEQAVLGSVLIEPSVLARAREKLVKRDFWSVAHGIIYSAFCHLVDARQPIDLISTADYLETQQSEDFIAGGRVPHD